MPGGFRSKTVTHLYVKKGTDFLLKINLFPFGRPLLVTSEQGERFEPLASGR